MTSAVDIDTYAIDEPAPAPRPGVLAASVAVSLPETVVSNAEISERLGVADDWIERRTGIQSRRFAQPDERLETHAYDGNNYTKSVPEITWAAAGVRLIEVYREIIAAKKNQ